MKGMLQFHNDGSQDICEIFNTTALDISRSITATSSPPGEPSSTGIINFGDIRNHLKTSASTSAPASASSRQEPSGDLICGELF